MSVSCRRIALTLGLAAALGGCGSPSPTPTRPAATTVPASAFASASASPPPTQPSGPPLVASLAPTGVDPDPALLELVPASEAGATLTYDPETTASVAANPSLAKDVNYLAIGLARPNGAGLDDPNLAIVNAVRLRDSGASDDAWFRDWRDTYDRAACAQAGGVARHAQIEVDGLVVFVGSCAGGAFTYHVRVADGGVVLSITSIGPADLGRSIVAKLHR